MIFLQSVAFLDLNTAQGSLFAGRGRENNAQILDKDCANEAFVRSSSLGSVADRAEIPRKLHRVNSQNSTCVKRLASQSYAAVRALLVPFPHGLAARFKRGASSTHAILPLGDDINELVEPKAVIHFAQDDLFVGITPSNHALVLDTDHERASAPTPMELLLVALGSCTAVDVISILKKKREQVSAYRVEVRGERRAEHPRSYSRMEVHHMVTGREYLRKGGLPGNRALGNEILQRRRHFTADRGNRFHV